MMNTAKLLLSEREAAQALGVSSRHLFTLRKRGEIPFVRMGNRVLYPVRALERWIEQQSVCSHAVSTGTETSCGPPRGFRPCRAVWSELAPQHGESERK